MTPRQQLKDQVWLSIAHRIADLSTCLRLKVGCVLLRQDGSVAGTGYNGSLPGAPHCAPETCNLTIRCLWTRHAERSALDYSTGIITTAYLTDEPCLRCTLDLIARGCRRVVYSRNYSPTAPELVERCRVIETYGIVWEQLAS